jgi:hypothetical protein
MVLRPGFTSQPKSRGSISTVKLILVFLGLCLLADAVAQQQGETPPNGTIYGSVIGEDGKPAKGIALVAGPLGVGLGTRLPSTKSNDAGEYRFSNLPWWGRYSVYAEDDDAGYSPFSTGLGDNDPSEVELICHASKSSLVPTLMRTGTTTLKTQKVS